MIAAKDAFLANLFQRQHWLPNIISGLIVGVVALPLAMAFAIASGAKPEQGIYTSIIAGIMVSLFGGSRLQIAGPTGAFIVVLSGITAQYGIIGLQIATMMAGVILVLFGIAKMGGVIKYIPAPVIIGFTSGIGVTIWVGQWQNFFGLPAIEGEHFHQKMIQLLHAFPALDLPTTLLASLSLLILIFNARIPYLKVIPAPLIALLAGTLLQVSFQFTSVETIGSAFGGIPVGLPSLQIPPFTMTTIIELIGPAFTIAMLGAIESLLSAVVADSMANTKHNSNQELVGQGLANIVTPLFGGFAATGAIARTATNIKNGGTSPLSGVIHSLTLVLILILLAPLAAYVPLATLAAILFVVAWNMSEFHHFFDIVRKAPKADVIILLITFLLTVFTDLVIAVNIGVILAMLHFLRRMANSISVDLSLQSTVSDLPQNLTVLTIDGPIFFAAVERFEHTLETTNSLTQTLVIDLTRTPFIDMTGILALEQVILAHQNRGGKIVLAGCNERVNKKLHKAGIIDKIGHQNTFNTLSEALNSQ